MRRKKMNHKRKRKCFWIKVGDSFVIWKKLALSESKDDAHTWKSEKTVNKYKDTVSEMYPNDVVSVINDFEAEPEYKVETKIIKEIDDEIVANVIEQAKDKELPKFDEKIIVDDLDEEYNDVVYNDVKKTEVEEVKEVVEKPNKIQSVKTFREYLSEDDHMIAEDFDFNIDD